MNKYKNRETINMEYKEYRDGDAFISQKRIYFADANPTKDISLQQIMKIASDIAVEDYRERGLSREFLVEKGYAILVSRNSFRIHKRPQENQVIQIKTWEGKPEALQLKRAYEFRDIEGELLITGNSTWLVVDLAKRRMIPTKMFTLRPNPEKEISVDCLDPAKITAPDGMELFGKHKIVYSDLDTNGHTTNSRYAAFIEDVIPEEFRSLNLKDIRLNYSKEAVLGEELYIYGMISEDKKTLTIIGKIEDKEISFESQLFY